MRQYSALFIFIISVILLTTSCRRAHTRNKGRNTKSETTAPANQLVETQTNSENVVIISDNHFTPPKTPSKEEILLYRIAYKVSYNTKTRQPNWVAWKLTREHTDGPFP